MNLRTLFLLFAIPLAGHSAESLTNEVIHLWTNGAPGFEDRKDIPEVAVTYKVNHINNPSVTLFLPPKEKATGAAVLVFPGGGNAELGFVPEGIEAGRYFASNGVAARSASSYVAPIRSGTCVVR